MSNAPGVIFDRNLHLPPDAASESLAGYDGVLAAKGWHEDNMSHPELPYKVLVPGIGVGTLALAFTAYALQQRALGGRAIHIDGFDISSSAVEYARINLESITPPANTTVFQGDWNNADTWHALPNAPYHLILFNPPYLPHDEVCDISKDYQGVPTEALDGGSDGLDHFRTVLARLPSHVDREHGATVLFRFQTPGARYVPVLREIIRNAFGQCGITWPSGLFPTEGMASHVPDEQGRMRWVSVGRIVIPPSST